MRNIWIAIVTVIIFIGVIFWFTREKPAPQPVQVTESPRPITTTPDPEEPDLTPELILDEPEDAQPPQAEKTLPELDASDDAVFESLGETSSHPYWERLEDIQHLIRKAATATDQVSREKNPFKQLFVMRPEGEFEVEQQGDLIYLSARNYDRYEPLISAMESLDTQLVARTYRFMEPLLREAYGELGNIDRDWDQTLKYAIAEVEATPQLDHLPELAGREGVYIFKDPDLEALAPVQKMFLRMGPNHTRRFIAKLKDILAAIDQL